jgi:hypothetical protein
MVSFKIFNPVGPGKTGIAVPEIGQVADKDRLQALDMKAVYKIRKRVRRPRLFGFQSLFYGWIWKQ